MNLVVETSEGVYTIDPETEQVVDFVAGAELSEIPQPRVEPHDAGSSWHEAGGGLPPGRAVAIAEGDPDSILYAAEHRVYVSQDGGRFWRALEPELPQIKQVGWLEA